MAISGRHPASYEAMRMLANTQRGERLPKLEKLLPSVIYKRIAHRRNLLQILDNIGWLFFDKILRMGVGLFVGVWVARYLGPGQFGLLSYAVAFAGLFGAVATLGLPSIVVRDIVSSPDNKEETLGAAIALQLVGGILAYGLIIGLIFWLRVDDAMARVIVAIVGAGILFKVTDAADYWFQSQVQSKYTVCVRNGVFLVFAFIKIGLILGQAPLVYFAWAVMGEAAISGVILLLVLGQRGLPLSTLKVSTRRLRTLLSDSWPMFLSSVAIMIYMRTDQIMLGQMVGDRSVGIYSVAVRISELWYFIPTAIVTSVFPAILKARAESSRLYYHRLQQLYTLMVWMAIAVALPMTFLATPLVVLVFGERYAAAGSVLGIHVWTAVFVFLGVASSKWFIAENLTKIALQRTALGAIVNVVLNLLLIPYYGGIGAAIATVVSYAVAAMFSDVMQQQTRHMFVMKLKAFNPLLLV